MAFTAEKNVRTYEVGLRYNAAANVLNGRELILNLAVPFMGVSKIYMYFKEEPNTESRWWEYQKTINIELPLEDFDRVHNLMQSEDPILARWTYGETRNGGIRALRTFFIGTAEPEETGEGPADPS